MESDSGAGATNDQDTNIRLLLTAVEENKNTINKKKRWEKRQPGRGIVSRRRYRSLNNKGQSLQGILNSRRYKSFNTKGMVLKKLVKRSNASSAFDDSIKLNSIDVRPHWPQSDPPREASYYVEPFLFVLAALISLVVLAVVARRMARHIRLKRAIRTRRKTDRQKRNHSPSPEKNLNPNRASPHWLPEETTSYRPSAPSHSPLPSIRHQAPGPSTLPSSRPQASAASPFTTRPGHPDTRRASASNGKSKQFANLNVNKRVKIAAKRQEVTYEVPPAEEVEDEQIPPATSASLVQCSQRSAPVDDSIKTERLDKGNVSTNKPLSARVSTAVELAMQRSDKSAKKRSPPATDQLHVHAEPRSKQEEMESIASIGF